jgi:pyruvate dehydrogenase E1 component beta subunit
MTSEKPHYRGTVETRPSENGKRFRRAVAEGLREEMLRDETVFLMGQDIGKNGGPFGVTLGLYDEFGPGRLLDTPICEPTMVGMAVGAALMGMRPVVEMMFMDFLLSATDQMVNNVAKMRYIYGEEGRLPLVVRTACGAGLQAGPTHGQSLYSMFAHIPGLKVVVPSTPYDAKGLLISSIRDNDPVLFVENMRLYRITGDVPDGDYSVPLGQAKIQRAGEDVTVVATMAMMHESIRAAEELQQEGLSIEVIDPRTLVPLDVATILDSVRKTSRLVVVDESPVRCGIQSEIASVVGERAFDSLDAPIQRVGPLDAPIPFSPALESVVLPGKERIIEAVRAVVS